MTTFNGKISDMTDSTTLPSGAKVPFIVETDEGAFSSRTNYSFPLGTQFLEDKTALADILAPSDGQLAGISANGGAWVFTTDDKSAEVAVDTYQAMFIAPSLFPTGSAGAWVRQIDGAIMAEWAGPFDTVATNHLRLQSLINLTEYVDAKIILPDYEIETFMPLYTRDYLWMEGGGSNSGIYNSNDQGGQQNSTVIVPGCANANFFSTNTNASKTEYFTEYLMGETTTGYSWRNGTYSVKMATLADAAYFRPGDKVWSRTKAYYTGGNVGNHPEIAHLAQSNLVVDSDGGTGIVTFKYPVLGDVQIKTITITNVTDNAGTIRITSAAHGLTAYQPITISGVGGVTAANGQWSITVIDANTFDLNSSTFAGAYTSGGTGVWGGGCMFNLTREVVYDTVTGAQIEPHINVTLKNFRVRANDDGFSFSRSCLLDSDLTNLTIEGPYGYWTNALTLCRVSANMLVSAKAIEMPLNCMGTIYSVNVRYEFTTGISTDPAFKFGECSSYNTVDLWFNGNFAIAGDSVIDFDNGVGNTVNVHSLSCATHTGNIITAVSTARTRVFDPVETQEPNADNTVNVMCPVFCAAPARYIITTNAGGRLTGFTVNGGTFTGTPATRTMVLEGTNISIVGGRYGAGRIDYAAAPNLILNIHGGPFTYDGNTGVLQEWVVNGVAQWVVGTQTTTSSTSYALDMSLPSQTLTFTGASFELAAPLNAVFGTTTRVTLINASGGVVTPTAVATYNLAGASWAAIDNTEAITFTARRVYTPSGSRVVIQNITPSLP